MKRDGHVHTPFCPHGSKDSLEAYVENALQKGITSISFTEHAPLPEGFRDPAPTKDSSMSLDTYYEYIEAVQALQDQYRDAPIDIRVGVELDYISGWEQQTLSFLQTHGKSLQDIILSVHFIEVEGKWLCIDYDEEVFRTYVSLCGGIEEAYDRYFQTVEKSIRADFGDHQPPRIGHLTLIRKFKKNFPVSFEWEEKAFALLHLMKTRNLALDYNSAGLRKPLCGETYPSPFLLQAAQKMRIPIVYGSDAHCAKDVGSFFDKL